MMKYGVRWIEINRNNQLVTKEKFFRTEALRTAHLNKLEEKGTLYEVLGYCDEE